MVDGAKPIASATISSSRVVAHGLSFSVACGGGIPAPANYDKSSRQEIARETKKFRAVLRGYAAASPEERYRRHLSLKAGFALQSLGSIGHVSPEVLPEVLGWVTDPFLCSSAIIGLWLMGYNARSAIPILESLAVSSAVFVTPHCSSAASLDLPRLKAKVASDLESKKTP